MLRQLVVGTVFFVFTGNICWAYDEDENWNISLLLGTHMPKIESLRNGLLLSPMIGSGTLSPENTEEGEDAVASFRFQSPLNGRFNAAKTSLLFRWNNASPVSMTFGFSTWEATAYGNSQVKFPIQGALENAQYEREISLSYTEYHIGATATAFKHKNFTIYGKFALNEIFDMDYREDLTFSFNQGTEDAYQRIIVLKAQTASLFSSTLGMGSEWALNKTISFGAELSYLLAFKSIKFQEGKLNYNILTRDQLNLNELLFPFAAPPGEGVSYLPENITQEQIDAGERHKPMNLSFSGWQFMLSMNIYY